MKNILKSLLAIAFMATLSNYANAQSLVRLCFQTGTSTQSCQPVTAANPLPSTATLSAAAALNVTVTNTTSAPVFVSNPNGFGGGANNVTITNTVAVPAIVSCTNCGAASITNVTEVNSANILSASNAIAAAAVGAIPAGSNTIGQVTCLNCTGSAGPFNVTVTNTVTVGAHNVSVTNTPAVTNTLATTGGWTPLLLNNLLTTVNAIKTTGGQLAKLFCYNPNASVAYVQVWNLTTGAVSVGTTTPTNSYGIPATTSAGFAMSTTGDEYSTAISIAATTAAKGGTPPTTGVDCNASYN